jgi:hypothetical protein
MHIPQFIPQGAINSLRMGILYDNRNQPCRGAVAAPATGLDDTRWII